MAELHSHAAADLDHFLAQDCHKPVLGHKPVALASSLVPEAFDIPAGPAVVDARPVEAVDAKPVVAAAVAKPVEEPAAGKLVLVSGLVPEASGFPAVCKPAAEPVAERPVETEAVVFPANRLRRGCHDYLGHRHRPHVSAVPEGHRADYRLRRRVPCPARKCLDSGRLPRQARRQKWLMILVNNLIASLIPLSRNNLLSCIESCKSYSMAKLLKTKGNNHDFNGFVHVGNYLGHKSYFYCKNLSVRRSTRRSVAKMAFSGFVDSVLRAANPFLLLASGCVTRTRGGSPNIGRGCLGKTLGDR